MAAPRLAASLNEPYEVRFDRAGNMFFAEMQNHVVRRVDAKTRDGVDGRGHGRRGVLAATAVRRSRRNSGSRTASRSTAKGGC